MNSNIKIIQGNCLDEIRKSNDDTFDHVITSPPYNMNLRIRNGKYCSRQIVKEFSTKYNGFDDNLSMDEYFEFHKNVILELLRVCKKYIFYIIQPVTGNKRALYKLMGEFNEYIKDVIIWDKIHGQPAMASGVMNSVYEYIIIFTKNKNDSISRQFKECSFNRGTLNNIWSIKRQNSISNLHSATFPEELINNIILKFTKSNELILDPFSGTGTTGICCIKNNRKYLGIELIKEYVDISIERIKNYTK
ncbi:MAG: site-specific DNA-methyltransferase [Ureaplasma sp.]|nr:site-specific DNA-methyltransferase [Ureaplasma sp.]MDE7222007.1 site-specific DNA-methyltransferase [Ureaplasma sp.]